MLLVNLIGVNMIRNIKLNQIENDKMILIGDSESQEYVCMRKLLQKKKFLLPVKCYKAL